MWTTTSCGGETDKDEPVIKDSNGNVLNDGDTVTMIKDLKEEGSSSVVKVGDKVNNFCLVDGIGAIKVKFEFVNKIKI